VREERAKRDPNYGRGEVSLDLSGLDMLDSDEVLVRLRRVFESPLYNPPRLPASAVKLLELCRKPDVQVGEIIPVLEDDQLLAAELVKLAQSAAFAGSGTGVNSLQEAIVRLGLKRTSDIFLQASLNMRVFRAKAYQKPMEALRKHSVAVAHIARQVSRDTALFDEHAFLCGLLHDAGVAAALIALGDTPRGVKPLPFEEISDAVGMAHSLAGGVLGRLWALPPEVVFVMEHHHHFVIDGHAHPTSAVIELSNHLAESVGCGFGQESHPESVLKALSVLELKSADLPRLEDRAAEIVAKLG